MDVCLAQLQALPVPGRKPTPFSGCEHWQTGLGLPPVGSPRRPKALSSTFQARVRNGCDQVPTCPCQASLVRKHVFLAVSDSARSGSEDVKANPGLQTSKQDSLRVARFSQTFHQGGTRPGPNPACETEARDGTLQGRGWELFCLLTTLTQLWGLVYPTSPILGCLPSDLMQRKLPKPNSLK